MDYNSGRILYENQAKTQKLIASTTKIMTFLIALEVYDLEEIITVGEEVLASYGTNIYLEVGEEISVKDLLYGLMLRSGNDAAIVLATNKIGEEEFIRRMNQKAKDLGMNDTVFENPHGLDESTENLSTAYDMALLAKSAYENETYRIIIRTKKYTTKTNRKSYVWYNRVSLLAQYKNCVGGKNGYTPKAGKTLVSYAEKGKKVFIIVTLNDDDIYSHHQKLYEEYFDLFDNYNIIDKDKFELNSSLVKNKLYLKESFSYPLQKEEIDKISILVEIINPSNNIGGQIIVKLENQEISRINLYIKEEKKKDKTIFQKLKNLFT